VFVHMILLTVTINGCGYGCGYVSIKTDYVVLSRISLESSPVHCPEFGSSLFLGGYTLY